MDVKLFETPQAKVYCTFCDRETANRTHLVCKKCDGVVVCLACLKRGVRGGTHALSHPYSVVQRLDFHLPGRERLDWTAAQELLLLQGVEKFGYGNWGEITDYIGSKSQSDVEEHFHTVYPLKRRVCASLDLKDRNYNGFANNKNKTRQSSRESDVKEHFKSVKMPTGSEKKRFFILDNPRSPSSRNSDRKDHCLRNLHFDDVSSGLRTPERTQNFRTLFDRVIESLQSILGSLEPERPTDTFEAVMTQRSKNLLGYMCHRDEFDVEYNNEAELYLADMEFKGNETEEELRTKMRVIEVYNSKRAQRDQRKRFVIEHRLNDLEVQLNRERQMSNEERLFECMMKPQLQYMNRGQYEELVNCYSMKLKLEKLRNYLFCSKRISGERVNSVLIEKNVPRLIELAREVSFGSNFRRGGEQTELKAQGPCTFDQLYAEELKFCKKEHLSFEDYLKMKEFLVKKSVINGRLSRSQELSCGTFEKRSFEVTFDFLTSNGLLIAIE